MTLKKYKIPVYRQIAKGAVRKTSDQDSPFDCDFYLDILDNESDFEVHTNNMPKTEVYKIQQEKGNKLRVETNTVNLLITNKHYVDPVTKIKTPLYNVAKNIPVSAPDDFFNYLKSLTGEQMVIESEEFGRTVYFNTSEMIEKTLNTFNLKSTEVISLRNNPNITIKRNKDRLVIDLLLETPFEDYTVKLGSEYLFDPIFHNSNWVEFHECIFRNVDYKIVHMYNHSFNEVHKEEVLTLNSQGFPKVKDPVVGEIEVYPLLSNANIYEVNYLSWRSNLLLSTEAFDELYVYVDFSNIPENRTKNLILSTDELTTPNLLLVLSKNKSKVDDFEIIHNEYTINVLREAESEKLSLIFTDHENSKYNTYNNVRFGTEVVKLDKGKMIEQWENYLVDSLTGERILQSKNKFTTDGEDEAELSGSLTSDHIDKMDSLLTTVRTVINRTRNTGFPDLIKLYKRG